MKINTKSGESEAKISIVILRMLIGWIFFRAGFGKLFQSSSYGGWAVSKSFFEQMGIPFPEYSLIMVGALELISGFLIFVGFKTKYAVIPLMAIIYGAIVTVHRQSGYYYPLFILTSCIVLFQYGSGRFSIDSIVKKK